MPESGWRYAYGSISAIAARRPISVLQDAGFSRPLLVTPRGGGRKDESCHEEPSALFETAYLALPDALRGGLPRDR